MRATALGLAAGAMFAFSAVGYRGAILGLGLTDYVMAATFTLSVGLFMIAVSAAWFDYPADVKIDSAEALNEAQEQGILGLKGFKGQISAKKITLGDYPGVEITAKNETSLLRFRTYIVGHRNYTLFAATLAEEPDQERVAKFFNSFRLRRPGRIG